MNSPPTTDPLPVEPRILAQTQTTPAFHHPDTKNYTATDFKNKKTTRLSIPHHQFPNSKTAAPTSCNPFNFIPIFEKAHKLHPTLINSNKYKISSTKCNTSHINQDLDIARIPTPYRFDRHPSPFTFASETFEPLFSHFSSTSIAYNCLPTTTGLTNFIEAMSSDHLDPNQLDTPFVPQPTIDPILHVPFLQHYSDLDSRTNPNAALLYYPDATLQDNINGQLIMQHVPSSFNTSITAATFCLHYITANLATKECIRDLMTDNLRHFFRELHLVLLVNDATISENDNRVEYI